MRLARCTKTHPSAAVGSRIFFDKLGVQMEEVAARFPRSRIEALDLPKIDPAQIGLLSSFAWRNQNIELAKLVQLTVGAA